MVRLVKCNSLDLELFQFDYDLTFCVFFLNPDRTIYARFGSRHGHQGDNDVAIEGLAATMSQVLQVHQGYPQNADSLLGKQPLPSTRQVPEEYPSLDHFESKLNYDGKVAKSCIHCHQVRDAQRLEFRTAGKPLPRKLLYPYPSSDTLGFRFDPKTRSSVDRVRPNTIAEKSGLKAGDRIDSIAGQAIASEADFGWRLHHVDDDARSVSVTITRNETTHELEFRLPASWRTATDLSWRPTSWELRRMATGGMTLIPLSDAERNAQDIQPGAMALRADHVGMYGNHARARKAGIRKGDIITSFDERQDLLTENALLAHALQRKRPGDSVTIEYLRNGERRTARIRLQ